MSTLARYCRTPAYVRGELTCVDIATLMDIMIHKGGIMIRKLGLFFFLVILIVACTTTTEEYELERTETRTWPAQGITQITALTENGNISMAPTTENTITAEITRSCTGEDSLDAEEHIDSIVVSDTIEAGELILQAEMPDDGDYNYQAHFDMTAPQSIYLDLSIVNGNISVEDMIAGARLRIVNGTITTQNLQGGIDGAIVNGTIDCDMAALAATESALLALTNGNVTLSLPSDVSASFDAATVEGAVTVTGFGSVTYTINEPGHKAGIIGTGEATIVIAVVNGDITIQAR